jgi:hypothetical protein
MTMKLNNHRLEQHILQMEPGTRFSTDQMWKWLGTGNAAPHSVYQRLVGKGIIRRVESKVYERIAQVSAS